MAVDDRLGIGSVIFEYVTDTHPPKDKYYIIVGFTDDEVALGTVYINTEINPNVFKTQQLRNLHIPLLRGDNPFLKYDSYIDCSQIHEKLLSNVKSCINSGDKKYGYISSIPEATLRTAIDTLDCAHTIPVIVKKKFGIRK